MLSMEQKQRGLSAVQLQHSSSVSFVLAYADCWLSDGGTFEL